MQCPVCKSEKMCGHKTTGTIIVVLLVIVGGYFLLKGSYQAPTPIPTQTPTVETSPTTQAPAAQMREISVSGTEFSFSPVSINLKAGEKVKITFKNNGQVIHNLTIEGLWVKTKTIGAGQTDTIEFIAPATGTFTFFCSVPGHRASGMEGDLIVE